MKENFNYIYYYNSYTISNVYYIMSILTYFISNIINLNVLILNSSCSLNLINKKLIDSKILKNNNSNNNNKFSRKDFVFNLYKWSIIIDIIYFHFILISLINFNLIYFEFYIRKFIFFNYLNKTIVAKFNYIIMQNMYFLSRFFSMFLRLLIVISQIYSIKDPINSNKKIFKKFIQTSVIINVIIICIISTYCSISQIQTYEKNKIDRLINSCDLKLFSINNFQNKDNSNVNKNKLYSFFFNIFDQNILILDYYYLFVYSILVIFFIYSIFKFRIIHKNCLPDKSINKKLFMYILNYFVKIFTFIILNGFLIYITILKKVCIENSYYIIILILVQYYQIFCIFINISIKLIYKYIYDNERNNDCNNILITFIYQYIIINKSYSKEFYFLINHEIVSCLLYSFNQLYNNDSNNNLENNIKNFKETNKKYYFDRVIKKLKSKSPNINEFNTSFNSTHIINTKNNKYSKVYYETTDDIDKDLTIKYRCNNILYYVDKDLDITNKNLVKNNVLNKISKDNIGSKFKDELKIAFKNISKNSNNLECKLLNDNTVSNINSEIKQELINKEHEYYLNKQHIQNEYKNRKSINDSNGNTNNKVYSTSEFKIKKIQNNIFSNRYNPSNNELNNSRMREVCIGKIIEYYPRIFDYIRKSDYIKSTDLSESFNIMNNLSSLNDIKESEGKSGSFFFYSYDKKYVVKTIKDSELQTVLDNKPINNDRIFSSYSNFVFEYANYIKNNSDATFLAKIYGIYSIIISNGSKINFILMQNLMVIPNKYLFRIFDLKGSKIDRVTHDLATVDETIALKDLDYLWINSNYDITDFSIDTIEIISNIINSDLNFLKKLNLMDYSILLIVGKFPSLEDNKYDSIIELFTNPLLRQRIYKSRTNKYIYCFGIIDYLQEFNLNKYIENKYKRLLYRSNVKYISAIDPENYAERLKLFFDKNVLKTNKLESYN